MQGTLEKVIVKVLSRYCKYLPWTDETVRLISDEIASEYYSAEAEANLIQEDEAGNLHD